ncbi:restriction endonuclease subunit S [Pseudoalteromonas gelatinilytica]|nr:restriction endonuclease subunit S [Pseudoalteromonas profundi]
MTLATKKLHELADVFSGYAFKSKDLGEEGIPVVKIKNVNEKIVSKQCDQFLPDNLLNERLKKYLLQEKDILVAMTGQGSLGRIGKMTNQQGQYLVNQRVGVVRPKCEDDSIADYLFGVLALDEFEQRLYSLGAGAGQPNVSATDIGNLDIPYPSKSARDFIANARANYDNLIENNNRRIAILEDMAQSLYREWFVNFRYPNSKDNLDADGNPKLVDSPLGQIPEGWEVGELKSFCSKIGSGATPRGGKGAYKKEGIPLIRSMNIYDSTLVTKDLAFIDDEQAARLKNVIVEPDDVLLNITGASVARCSIVPSAYTPARVNQHVAIIRLNNDRLSPEYLMYTLISKNGKARLLSTAQGGATREALTKTDIEKFQVVVPPSEIIKKFRAFVKESVKQKEVLFLKNENLKQQRDMLLPKLISGQIELKD